MLLSGGKAIPCHILGVAPKDIFDHAQFFKGLPPNEKSHEPPLVSMYIPGEEGMHVINEFYAESLEQFISQQRYGCFLIP